MKYEINIFIKTKLDVNYYNKNFDDKNLKII